MSVIQGCLLVFGGYSSSSKTRQTSALNLNKKTLLSNRHSTNVSVLTSDHFFFFYLALTIFWLEEILGGVRERCS